MTSSKSAERCQPWPEYSKYKQSPLYVRKLAAVRARHSYKSGIRRRPQQSHFYWSMIMNMLGLVFSFLCLTSTVLSQKPVYPVPTPAQGRMDVHGWLILPIDIDVSANSSSLPLVRPAWFNHHVPEFWQNSPHDFQIIFLGTIFPTKGVAPSPPLLPLALPAPPLDNLLTFEYSITPPSPFSLNDLLNRDIRSLFGVYYNGSFDTPYDRIPLSLAQVTIDELTTADYIDEFAVNGYEYLTYLSYPRSLLGVSGQLSDHYYLSHAIKVQPDFDHVVHAVLTKCKSSNTEDSEDLLRKRMNKGGLKWSFPAVPNDLAHKLAPGQKLPIQLLTGDQGQEEISCQTEILESIHCMVGPGFMENC